MADRPIECTECKKPLAFDYTEMIEGTCTQQSMCKDCPVLQQKLHGLPHKESGLTPEKSITGLCCGRCDTSLEAVRTGSPLGCGECYEVFMDVLMQELKSQGKVSYHTLKTAGLQGSLHIGRSPGELSELNPSLQLLALNEALSETLTREDYEQAAWLRDQIKALQEKQREDTKG
jgi:protein arginine kinase activator